MNLLRNKRLPFVLLTLITLLIASVISSLTVFAQEDDIVISVDASDELGEISPLVYGLNHNPGGIAPDMHEQAKAIDLNFLRFPHGNWGDENDLTPFQIDLYMIEVEAWGATPSINVRLDGGTPEQAADLVRYTNIEKEYDVRYWYVGNEPNLFDDYSIEQYVEDWRTFALAMLDVDPDIILIGPEVSQFPDTFSTSDFNYELYNVWLREFLTHNGDLVDIVSVHRYPFPLGTSVTTIAQMRENVPRWSNVVANMRNMIDEVIGEDMPIGITEVNSHWSNSGAGVATPDSYYNSVWWSGVLTTLIHEEVDLVSYFMLYSAGANNPFGILDRYDVRPSYYTYVLFTELGEMRVQSESSDEYITAIAANREDGATTLIITNLYEEEKSMTLDLSGFDELSLQEMRLLLPDVMAESVAVEDYLSEDTLTMPAQSVMLLVFG